MDQHQGIAPNKQTAEIAMPICSLKGSSMEVLITFVEGRREAMWRDDVSGNGAVNNKLSVAVDSCVNY